MESDEEVNTYSLKQLIQLHIIYILKKNIFYYR